MFAEDLDRILSGRYPGKSHALRAVELLREKVPNAKGYLYLEGRMSKLLEDSDELEPFRQRRHFYYLTGCDLSNCYLLYDIDSSKSTLFIPPIDPEEVVWCGLPFSPQQALETFDVDEVKFSTELDKVLSHLSGFQNSTVYTVADQVSPHIKFGLENVDSSILKGVIDRCRVVKDEYEVAMIRKANIISSLGHEAIMKRVSKASNEMQLEAEFLGHCVAHGAKKMAYPPIVAAGRAGATLHYEANNKAFGEKQNLLVDAGAEWNNYASDITRTFPLSGTLTKESRQIYDIVYKMQMECIAIIKAGVRWEDVHMLAHEIAIEGLLEVGILQGAKANILDTQTSLAFFPHGLGHFLGLDTHDVGGNPNFDDDNKYFRYLRTRGTLPTGSVVTVEPGIYFCEQIIRPYLEDERHKALINPDVLDKYWDVGGVRRVTRPLKLLPKADLI
ncbi:hypothetical protein LCI18_009725 [Fusarium solani-melongenae]|uniref:Uncharacterized protein n=1 Tax=Fusarium solani subsp. cucurbitae TaxID=2747967 RepID=A0ACD3ZC65_FUSSC|nr:hypothetical protein LCI18_009725 [Fusarium solani-melongenae]